MTNWLSVLSRAKECLDGVICEESKPAAPESAQNRAQNFLNNIIGLSKLTKGHKLISNFEVAAMHLNIHMQVSFFHPCA
jgi:hypothetical protein